MEKDEQLNAVIHKRQGRMQDTEALLSRARVGLLQIVQRLALFKRGSGTLPLGSGLDALADGPGAAAALSLELSLEEAPDSSSSSGLDGRRAAVERDGEEAADAASSAEEGGGMLRALARCESELCHMYAEVERAHGAYEARHEAALLAKASPPSEASLDSLFGPNTLDAIFEDAAEVPSARGGARALGGLASRAGSAPGSPTTAPPLSLAGAASVNLKMVPLSAFNVRHSDSISSAVGTVGMDKAIELTFADINQWRDERATLRAHALGLPLAKGAVESPTYTALKSPRANAAGGVARASVLRSSMAKEGGMRESGLPRESGLSASGMGGSLTDRSAAPRRSMTGSSLGGSLTERPLTAQAGLLARRTGAALQVNQPAGPQPPKAPRPASGTPRARPSSARVSR